MAKLIDIGERSAVRRVLELVAGPAMYERLGPGDDARDLVIEGPRILVAVDGYSIASSMLPWRSLSDIGWCAVTGAVSDIVAKGGWPSAVLLALGADRGWSLDDLLSLVSGARDAAVYYGARLVGGDTNSSSDPWVSATVIGFTSTAYPPPRHGARPGDIIVATGDRYGAMGVVALDGTERAGGLKWVVEATRRPTVDTRVSAIIQEHAKAIHATMDVSDGLAYTLAEMLLEKGLGAALDRAPRHPVELREYCRGDTRCVWERVMYGGEEYGVVMIIDRGLSKRVLDDLENHGVPYEVIGRVTDRPGIVVEGLGPIEVAGWDQFKGWIHGPRA